MYPSRDFGVAYYPKGSNVEVFGTSYGSATPEQRAARAAHRYYGPGAYSAGKNWRRFSQGIGLTGAARSLLHAGTSMATRLVGAGAYGNSLMHGGDAVAEVPMVSSAADETGAVTISRREFVADIYAPGELGATSIPAFSNQVYSLNPGLEETFPWLSQIAQNYEEYSFEQLIFHYRSTVTDIGSSTTGQCGTVIMATNYNSAAVEFSDKNAMQAYDGAMSCKSTDSMTHGVECDDSKRAGLDALYVRAGAVPLGQDIKTYDHGLFQMALANLPVAYAGQTVGELWVSYTVKLSKPKFAVARGSAIERDIFVSNNNETATRPMGTTVGAMLSGQQNSLGCQLDLSVDNRIRIIFPPAYAGFIEIALLFESSTGMGNGVINPASSTTAGNVAFVNDIYAGGAGADGADNPSYYSWPRAVTGGSFLAGVCILHCRVTPASAGIRNVVDVTTAFTAAPTQMSVDIREYNAGFSSRALGIGPIGARSDAPILIDRQGQQVVP